MCTRNSFIFILVMFSYLSCNKNYNQDIKKDIYEITTNIISEDAIIAKIDSVSNLIKSGEEKQKIIRAYLYLSITDLKNALNDFNDVVKDYPEDSYVNTGLGMVYIMNSDSAFHYFNKAILLDDGNSLAYFGRSIVQEMYEDKISTISKAIELYPECSMYYSWRGCFYESIDSTELAIKDFNRSFTFYKPYPLSFSMLGIIYEGKKDYEKALDLYTQQIEITAKKRFGYELKGDLFYKMDKYYDAIEEYKKAITFKESKSSSDNSFYFKISKIYSLLSEKDSSYKYLDLVLKKDTLYRKYFNKDEDFINVKNTSWFKEYIRKYSKK